MPTTYAIPDGRTVMAATLYTGNASTQTITNTVNGISFASELVWIKDRSAARQNSLSDIVRGTNKELFSDSTDADTSPATPVVTAFNSNGFTLGANGTVNASGESFVAWQWKAGGSGSSNTNGSITSTVSAGATQGFSVVTYTGNGTGGATVGHGLGVAPNFILAKGRTNVDNWRAYHSSLGNTGALILNATNSFVTNSTFWNNTSPSSTVVTLGSDTSVNQSSNTFVLYCFAAVAGYSAFGSYTGNGSADGPFVYLGFRPRWVMIKSSTNSTYWYVYDSARNTYNLTTQILYPNLSSAEATGVNSVLDFLSNGLKIRDPGAGELNISGATFIYACFAENPFKFANAR
jgi:hypothetical protein